jgi:predicted ATPase
MTASEQYRTLAAKVRAKARNEMSSALRTEWENLAQCYIRLAAQADQNSRTDITYEPILRPRLGDLDGEPA